MLDSEAFPSSLVLSRENNLVIGQLETLHELQIRTVRVSLVVRVPPCSNVRMKIAFGNESPIRIAHDEVSKMFGLAIVRTDTPPPGEMELAPSVSSLRLLDDVSFARTFLV